MPPCPSDIIQYGKEHGLINNDTNKNKIDNKKFSSFEVGKPLTPLLQLLTVVPSYSFDLLPESIHDKLNQHIDEIKKWFPDKVLFILHIID